MKGTHLGLVDLVVFLIFISMAFSNILIVEGHKHNGKMKAILTLNDFSKGGDGGGPSKCSGKY